ncbi:hypothetical protein CLV46_2133 [Diaminobutyricimonas aerilata]|uniref:Uncharacterized protein n=1 Tax=Diaminobutyricimonas aerilata TaxID=1162967 RepID=A0A2M9CKX4_9MICO|nr:hypothetical protein CLV46_2133 [Diaminobutyricimonas aerilata]
MPSAPPRHDGTDFTPARGSNAPLYSRKRFQDRRAGVGARPRAPVSRVRREFRRSAPREPIPPVGNSGAGTARARAGMSGIQDWPQRLPRFGWIDGPGQHRSPEFPTPVPGALRSRLLNFRRRGAGRRCPGLLSFRRARAVANEPAGTSRRERISADESAGDEPARTDQRGRIGGNGSGEAGVAGGEPVLHLRGDDRMHGEHVAEPFGGEPLGRAVQRRVEGAAARRDVDDERQLRRRGPARRACRRDHSVPALLRDLDHRSLLDADPPDIDPSLRLPERRGQPQNEPHGHRG